MPARASKWRVIALSAIVANVAFNYATEYIDFGVGGMVTLSQRYQNLFTPAGYAFSIWGVIYASFVAYAIVALLPSQRGRAIHDRLAPLLALANLLTSVWLVVFRMNWIPVSFVVIASTLVVAVVMYRRVIQAYEARVLLTRWWTVPFAMFMGWLSVATIANASILLVALGWHGSPFTEPALAIAMLAVAGLLGFMVSVTVRDAVVPAVIAWAAIAIWREQHTLEPDVGVAALIVAALTGAAAAGSTVRRVLQRLSSRTMPYRVNRPS